MTKPFRMPGPATFAVPIDADQRALALAFLEELARPCACGKPATHELTDTVEGEAEPRSREPLCEDCAAWIIDGAPVRGNA